MQVKTDKKAKIKIPKTVKANQTVRKKSKKGLTKTKVIGKINT